MKRLKIINQLLFKSGKIMKSSDNNNKLRKKKKKFSIDTKNMGVNIDKNEYYEIVQSNSARPEYGL